MNNVDRLLDQLDESGHISETVSRSRPLSERHLEPGDVLEAVESLELPRGMTCEPGTHFAVARLVGKNLVELNGADKPLVRVKRGGVPVEASMIQFRVPLSFVRESMRRIVS